MTFFDETEGVVNFGIRVVPCASKSKIIGEIGEILRVRILAPVEGAANTEVVKVLAKALSLTGSRVAIVAGQTSRTKRIRIDGVTAREARGVFGP